MLPWPGRQKAMIRLMVSTSFPVPFEACWRGDSTGKEANPLLRWFDTGTVFSIETPFNGVSEPIAVGLMVSFE